MGIWEKNFKNEQNPSTCNHGNTSSNTRILTWERELNDPLVDLVNRTKLATAAGHLALALKEEACPTWRRVGS